MRTNAKGDIARIAEIQLTPKNIKEPAQGFNVKVATKYEDSRDGALYVEAPVDRAINVDAMIAAGVVTSEEWQSVYLFFAKCYDADLPEEPAE